MLVLPGLGVVLHQSTGASADAMALCLADVAARIPAGAAIERLTPEQEFELMNWDAEKYRQALEIKSVAP
jgi:rhamnose utilization protein RhaD (predicted bifunctional aldolase and dehydrogenase)